MQTAHVGHDKKQKRAPSHRHNVAEALVLGGEGGEWVEVVL